MTNLSPRHRLLHAADVMYTIAMNPQDFLQTPRAMIEYLLEPWLDDPTALVTPIYPVMLLYDFAVALNLDDFFLAELPEEAYQCVISHLDTRILPADANGAGTTSRTTRSGAPASTAPTRAGRPPTARDTHG